uniref:Sperm-tail PG-rich repeat containing 4 n=1 Tax=Hippocampus comes TaxID=109280 RepID=A0A3Q2XWQ3_HIPCM
MTGLDRIRELIEESDVNPIRKSCGFKGTDRERQPMGLKTGEVPMRQAMASSSFKMRPRPDVVTLGIRDKHINTSPCDYNVTAKPKEGPAPGAYTLSSKPADGITSCFKSKLPRLHSVTPGPGAYEPHWKWLDNLTLKTTVEPSFSLLFRNTP